MASFLAQVQGLTGLTVSTSPTSTELETFLNDGVKDVVNRIINIENLFS